MMVIKIVVNYNLFTEENLTSYTLLSRWPSDLLSISSHGWILFSLVSVCLKIFRNLRAFYMINGTEISSKRMEMSFEEFLFYYINVFTCATLELFLSHICCVDGDGILEWRLVFQIILYMKVWIHESVYIEIILKSEFLGLRKRKIMQ